MVARPEPHHDQPLRREGPPPQQAPLVVLLVHGRGQDTDFMVDVAERSGLSEMHRVYPAATDKSWYPARFDSPPAENEPWLRHALEAVDRALAALRADRVPAARTVLVGFSQGACLLAEHLARRPRCYAAVALFTGCDIRAAGAQRDLPPGSLTGLPILMSSSEHDEWIPPERIRATAALFTRAGARVDLRIHSAREHGVDDEETARLRELVDTTTERRQVRADVPVVDVP